MSAVAQDEAVQFDDLPTGAKLRVKTRHHAYVIERLSNGHARIAGHPQYCPEPTEVDLRGSSWNGYMPQRHLLAPGMQLEFLHPGIGIVRTSRIEEIERA